MEFACVQVLLRHNVQKHLHQTPAKEAEERANPAAYIAVFEDVTVQPGLSSTFYYLHPVLEAGGATIILCQ